MSVNPNISPQANIIFTDSAATKVRNLIQEEGDPDLKLRVYITGGGCSGFQYGFTFDKEIKEGKDWVIEKRCSDDPDNPHSIVYLLIDPASYMYLQGAEIDYREDMQGSQFIIRNPQAKTTCGCGSSFSVE